MGIIIKTTEQIDGIRKSCKLAAKTLNMLDDVIQPGITTEGINTVVETFIRDHGATPAPLNYMGYPKSVCTSVNEVICHGIPSDETVLKEGDVINVDVTTILDGYYGDTCKMFPVGEISESSQKLLNVAKECLQRGIDQVFPNSEFARIGDAISRHARDNDYSVVFQFCGHGVGLQFHEEPHVSHHVDASDPHFHTKMQPGMIFTIEPMINEGSPEAVILEDKWTAITIDKKLSAQYEHTLLVTDEGHEVLTLLDI